jgi:type IV pilus assembly protein PilX
MTYSAKSWATPPRKAERGIALFLVLVFLVILTILGIAAIQGVTLNERVARNQLDRNIAFQAAEAALRDAERDISRRKADGSVCTPTDAACRPLPVGTSTLVEAGKEPFSTTCIGGLCEIAVAPAPPVWEVAANWTRATTYGSFTGAPAINSVSRQPVYLIETSYYENAGWYYRITARGFGVNDQTWVTLQSSFKPQQGT